MVIAGCRGRCDFIVTACQGCKEIFFTMIDCQGCKDVHIFLMVIAGCEDVNAIFCEMRRFREGIVLSLM